MDKERVPNAVIRLILDEKYENYEDGPQSKSSVLQREEKKMWK